MRAHDQEGPLQDGLNPLQRSGCSGLPALPRHCSPNPSICRDADSLHPCLLHRIKHPPRPCAIRCMLPHGIVGVMARHRSAPDCPPGHAKPPPSRRQRPGRFGQARLSLIQHGPVRGKMHVQLHMARNRFQRATNRLFEPLIGLTAPAQFGCRCLLGIIGSAAQP